MKDLMIDWVEEHKGENRDGTWFVMGLDWVGEKQFETEQQIDEFLWNLAIEDFSLVINIPQDQTVEE